MSSEKTLPAYFGRYQVVEELGSGAMGVVYLCVDPRLARPVAIKVLKESEALGEAERTQFRSRFRHEAEAAGRLNHPDIVQLFDSGPSYLVMEYVEGQTLSSLLRAGAELRVKQITSLVMRVADAIDYAHKNGVVHRDLKPANVMLANDGGVKVMDFGVARLESSNLTVAGTVVGSVRYMAPEQMMGERVDGRADVFSLGAVAYELLTGRGPFPGKTITEVVSRVVHGNHVPPREVEARFPEATNVVFAKVFAARPDARYPRAVDFARELQQALKPVLDLVIVHRGEGAARAPSQATTVKGAPAAAVAAAPPAARPSVGPQPAPAVSQIAPAPARREGVLLLDSDPPGAAVYVDGSPVGSTPVHGLEVSFGRHVVRMEAPARDAVSAEVDVRRERPLKALTFTLPEPGSAVAPLRPGQLVPLGPDVVPPRRVSGAVPAYPEAARERGLEGSPVVEVWVSETGDVIDVAIVESAGAILDAALLEAVTGWRFTPPSCRGVPVSVRMSIQHLFRR